MRLLIATIVLVTTAIGLGQDRIPDASAQSLIKELYQLNVIGRPPIYCKSPPPARYEQAVALFAAYQSFIDPKVRTRLGSGYGDIVLRVRRATSSLEKELASLGVDVEAMKLHLRALAKGEGFPDVPPNHWASKATTTLKELGLLKGYPDGLFRSD